MNHSVSRSAIIKSLRNHIKLYRFDLSENYSLEDKEDIMRIANIAESICDDFEKNNMELVKQKLGGFYRNVSDAYCMQPPSFKALAKDIAKIKSIII